MTLPESPAAAQAVFDRVNQQGGIQGRRIEYVVQDDKGDAGITAQSSRELVDSQGVVAFAGSASLQDCTVNGNFYRQRNVLSIPGVGGEFSCYSNRQFAPVSVGPARGSLAALYFASEKLGKKKVCAFLLGIPAHMPGNAWTIRQYQAITHKKLALVDTTTLPSDDMTPHVLRARDAGCDAIVFAGAEQMDLAWVKAMQMQNMGNVTLILDTPAYTSNFAQILGTKGDGIYANSEYEPFLGTAPALTDWRNLMQQSKVPLSSFAQGGYISATLLVEALKKVKGPITRESVTEALRSITGENALHTPMLGMPFDFGVDSDHLSTSATKFVELKDGKWETVTPDFMAIKPAK